MVALDDKHFISVSERSSYIWSCTGEEPRRIMTVKNMPDSSTPFYPNTVIVNTFEQSSGGGMGRHSTYHHDIGSPSHPLHVMYCIAGHKMHAGRIPSLDESKINNSNREVCKYAGLMIYIC